jgi:hypothetical protein
MTSQKYSFGLPGICPTLPFKIPRMKTANQFIQVQAQVQEDRFPAQVHRSRQPLQDTLLPFNDAIQIKAAEYWLKLGEADQALRELEVLPSRVWKSGWELKTRIAAIGVLRERSGVTIQN